MGGINLTNPTSIFVAFVDAPIDSTNTLTLFDGFINIFTSLIHRKTCDIFLRFPNNRLSSNRRITKLGELPLIDEAEIIFGKNGVVTVKSEEGFVRSNESIYKVCVHNGIGYYQVLIGCQ